MHAAGEDRGAPSPGASFAARFAAWTVAVLATVAVGPGCGSPELPDPDPAPAPASTSPAPMPAPADPPLSGPEKPPENSSAAIEHLLGAIESSPLVFIRNGTEHSGKEAAAHIRSKRDHFQKQIVTPEDFITKAATKSELTGKPYLVRLADGTPVELATWLETLLEEWRSAPRR